MIPQVSCQRLPAKAGSPPSGRSRLLGIKEVSMRTGGFLCAREQPRCRRLAAARAPRRVWNVTACDNSYAGLA